MVGQQWNPRDAISPESSDASYIEKWCWIKTEVKKANVSTRKELDDAVFRSRGGIRRAQIRALYCSLSKTAAAIIISRG